MAVLIDIEQITIRTGPSLVKFGDMPVAFTCQGKVEHDRFLHIYAGLGKFPLADFAEISRRLIEMGRRYGWRGVRWERVREDGAVHTYSRGYELS